MWIFGYGSLMYDGWEKIHQCRRREQASLLGHERSFTKASTERWGTKEYPAPTLQVIPSEGKRCEGVAFEFAEDSESEVLSYLSAREGKGFSGRMVDLALSDGTIVAAVCFFYTGKNVIADRALDDLAAMAIVAKGTAGSGLDYVRQTKQQLDSMGIHDKSVDTYFAAVAQRAELS